jgi:chromosome condensin MukBEF ATPase and DNA-binding subunit MukB
MTNEEVERAIDFLLKSQANSEARIEQTNEQLNQLAEQLGSFADTQTEMMRVMIRFIESQTLTNDSTAARQARVEEALVRLADAQTQSDRRLDALIKIVGEERDGH